jgi:hypothetical protein
MALAKTFGFESTNDKVFEGLNLSGKRVLIIGISAIIALLERLTHHAHIRTTLGDSYRSTERKAQAENHTPRDTALILLDSLGDEPFSA